VRRFFLPSLSEIRAFLLTSVLIVYRPALRAKSDADIIRDARREALGLPPAAHDEEERGPRGPRMATDEQVMERFKKRMRK
jgi:hypothetical protein